MLGINTALDEIRGRILIQQIQLYVPLPKSFEIETTPGNLFLCDMDCNRFGENLSLAAAR